ncbi:MAG: Rap1a/Tai family immunity protein [Candidatus Binatia bacterium]
MRALLIGLVGGMLNLLPVFGAAEEPALSGKVLLKQCESALQERSPRSFEAGVCVGMLQTLTYIQPLLDPKYGKAGYCLPQGLAYEQEVRVVVTYLQSHPERLQEEGRTLALDALHQAFPCKE